MNLLKYLFTKPKDQSEAEIRTMKAELNQAAKDVIKDQRKIQGQITKDLLFAMRIKV